MIWLLPLLAAGAHAQSATYTTRVCVDILTDFQDADYTGPVVAGDYWTTNQGRPARGALVQVTDANGGGYHRLGADGCIDLTVVQASPQHYAFTVQVVSEAIVNGVHLWARDGRSLGGFEPPDNSDHVGELDTVGFAVPFTTSQSTLTISTGDQRWNMLALAMWAMHRNTFGLGTFSSRDCCLETDPTVTASYDADEGTCPGDPLHQYAHTWSAYQASTDIELYSNGSGGSRRTFLVNGVVLDEPAVMVGSKLRYLVAHELGHVIVEKRMGRYTRRFEDADVDECNGGYNPANIQLPVGDHIPSDEDHFAGNPPHGKGAFSKEFQALAAREGWATFFAVWLFNNRTHTDGQMDYWKIHDLDRDGLIDNDYDFDTTDTGLGSINYGQHTAGDGMVWMGTHPVKVGPVTAPNFANYAKGQDWLELLVAAADNPAPPLPYGCVDNNGLANRSTEYDWARFFWDMTLTTRGNIGPATLADLYVDMCPTNWEGRDGSGAMPIDRLEQSAIHQGPAVETEWSLRKSWGQDH